MTLVRKLDEIYGEETLEKRFIAKSLFWVCLVSSLVFITGSIMNIHEADYLSVFALFLLVSILLLFKKKLNFVSNSVIAIALVIGFIIGVFSIDTSLYGSFISMVYLMPTLASIALLAGSVRQSIIANSVVTGGVAISFFYKVLPAARELSLPMSSTVNLLVTPLLMTIIVSVLNTMVVFSTKNIISLLSESESDSNKRVHTLKELFGSIKETINVGEELNTSAETSLGLTGTIADNLVSIEKSIDDLLGQIDSTQKIHESIEHAGRRVKESAHTQSTAVEQSASAVEEMASSIVELSKTAESRRELIEQLVKTEQDVSTQIQQGQKSFDEVKNSAGEMLSVVSVITDISERTNLLAMNAAIEAAHAGNSGRGFAIVAQEIRKLAVEAGSNSQKIKGIIESSIQGIDNAVEINSKVGHEFYGVSKQIQEIDIALSDIITGFTELAEGTNEITKVVENLALSNNSVQISVGEVTDQLNKGRESVDSISSATGNIKKNMNEIADDSVSIKEEAENIYKIGKNNVKHIRTLEENLV